MCSPSTSLIDQDVVTITVQSQGGGKSALSTRKASETIPQTEIYGI